MEKFENSLLASRRKFISLTLKTVLFFVISISFLHFASAVFAQGAASVRIQPALFEEMIEPGEIYSSTIRITNLSDAEKTYYFVKKDIRSVDLGGIPTFADEGEETGFEISSWVEMETLSVTLGVGESSVVPFTITVPENASPGGHYGAIFVTLDPPRLRETGTGVGYQVGSILNFRVAGDAVEEARIRQFSTGRNIYRSAEKIDFLINIENLGNVAVQPIGTVEIVNSFTGRKVGEVPVNVEQRGRVFPFSERKFSPVWEDDGFYFGRYEAIASFSYGDTARKSISSSILFWVLPIKLILSVLGGIAGLLLLLYVGVRLHIRKKLVDMGAVPAGAGVSAVGIGAHPLYQAKAAPVSRLTVITIAALSFSIIFLIILFILFS
jgi:hypothetical protein